MAQQVLIHSGVGGGGKIRNPWAVLGLTLITLGFYGWYWWYQINREIAEYGRVRHAEGLGDKPALSLVAYSVGGFVFVPVIWTIVTTADRTKRAQQLAGVDKPLNGWIYALLWIFTLGWGGIYYEQHHMNKWLRTQVPGSAAVATASA